MLMRVESLSDGRLDAFETIALERGEQLLLGHLQADREVARQRIGGIGGGMLQGAGQVVGDAQQVAGELGDGVGAGVVDLPLGAPAGVFSFRRIAQSLILQGRRFGAKHRYVGRFGGPTGGGVDVAFVGRLAVFLLARAIESRVIVSHAFLAQFIL